jgi:hypothetical protein
MDNRIKLILLLLFKFSLSVAQVDFKKKFAVSNIPSQLLKDANVVIRKYEVTFNVLNKGEAVEEEHKVVTILNDKAEGYNEQYFYYSKLLEIEDIEATVYDALGNKVKQLKKKDISDFKPYQEYVTDIRYKKINFPRLELPYTIEYSIRTKHKGLMFYPLFKPQQNSTEAVEDAHFNLVIPKEMKARVKEINLPKGVKQAENTWNFNNIAAYKPSSYLPTNLDIEPLILTAPTTFSIDGYEGSMETWEQYSRFFYQLNKDRMAIPAALQAKLQQLTANCSDDYCKIQKIYELLQNTTRYFYVGLGIGGWQPMSAKEVDAFKYGDCKGLSNYLVAMLNAVGVPAHFSELSNDLKKKYLYERLNINNFELLDFKLERKKERLASVSQEIRLNLPNIAAKSGNRLFVPINLLSRWTTIPPAEENRAYPIQAHSRGFTEKDTIEIVVPKGYKIENAFSPIQMTTKFGQYELNLKQEGSRFFVHRTFILNNSIQNKDKYQELTDFFKTVSKYDKTKIVVVAE